MSLSDFDVLVYSFGQQMLTHVGRENLASLLVRPYAEAGTADVLVRLHDNSWDAQLAAMESIDEVRRMFLGELSFEFRFLAETDIEPTTMEPELAEYRQIVAA